ncbi:hypothetical protein CDIK_3914 [Cucumispora dikerogammari]|nr:hypothetical protein CDIK_3914 [Cucumispora dikerogammari]
MDDNKDINMQIKKVNITDNTYKYEKDDNKDIQTTTSRFNFDLDDDLIKSDLESYENTDRFSECKENIPPADPFADICRQWDNVINHLKENIERQEEFTVEKRENDNFVTIEKSYSIYNFLLSSVIYSIFIIILLEICCFLFYARFLTLTIVNFNRKSVHLLNNHNRAIGIYRDILKIERRRQLIKILNLQ